MFIEVTGSVQQPDGTATQGKFFVNHAYIAALAANGTKATFHMASGFIIYSDANLADVLKQIDNAKLFGD
jgi:hypothetical protein